MARLSPKYMCTVKPKFQRNSDYLLCMSTSLTLHRHTWKFVFQEILQRLHRTYLQQKIARGLPEI